MAASRQWIRLTAARDGSRMLVNVNNIACFDAVLPDIGLTGRKPPSGRTNISWIDGSFHTPVLESIEDIAKVLCQELWEDIPL